MNPMQRKALKDKCTAAKVAEQLKPPGSYPPTIDNGPPATPPKPKREHGRLPHGSMFSFSYDAHRQMWSGSLIIGGSGAKFEGEHSAVFKLFAKCDGMYRATLPKE